MKAAAGVLAVLLVFGSMALGQTASDQQTASATASATAAASATEPAASSAEAAAGVAFGARAKLFLEPMDGFGPFLAEALGKKKVPVVVVNDRAKADFVVSGGAHVKKRGFFSGMVMSTGGHGGVSFKDARTDKQVFACDFRKVNQMETESQIYQDWANGCARHLKKTIQK